MMRQLSRLVRVGDSQAGVLAAACVLACLLACVAVVAAGCGSSKVHPQTDPQIEIAPAPAPVTAPVLPPPPPPPPPKPLRLAVLVSDEQPEYTAVATALGAGAQPELIQVFQLHGKAALAREAAAQIRAANHQHVVAVGMLAARTASEMETAQVVFCQVFNHREQPLLGPNTRGIEAVPPLDQAIQTWRGLGAQLTRIGVITGPGHEGIVAPARKLLRRQGVELVHRVTASDKETILEFQRMLPDIDGYWLLPDNRVLSRNALKDLMSLSRRANIGVLVHDPRFFELGALISAASDPMEIAERARTVLLKARDAGGFDKQQMYTLRRSQVQVNRNVATQLGYRLDGIPKALVAQ